LKQTLNEIEARIISKLTNRCVLFESGVYEKRIIGQIRKSQRGVARGTLPLEQYFGFLLESVLTGALDQASPKVYDSKAFGDDRITSFRIRDWLESEEMIVRVSSVGRRGKRKVIHYGRPPVRFKLNPEIPLFLKDSGFETLGQLLSYGGFESRREVVDFAKTLVKAGLVRRRLLAEIGFQLKMTGPIAESGLLRMAMNAAGGALLSGRGRYKWPPSVYLEKLPDEESARRARLRTVLSEILLGKLPDAELARRDRLLTVLFKKVTVLLEKMRTSDGYVRLVESEFVKMPSARERDPREEPNANAIPLHFARTQARAIWNEIGVDAARAKSEMAGEASPPNAGLLTRARRASKGEVERPAGA
jgi:hypothetical protein